MSSARTQSIYNTADFICRNKTLFVGCAKYTDCTHYIEADIFCNLSSTNFIKKHKVSLYSIRKNQGFAFTEIKPCSTSKKRNLIRIDILNSNEFTAPDFIRFFIKIGITR